MPTRRNSGQDSITMTLRSTLLHETSHYFQLDGLNYYSETIELVQSLIPSSQNDAAFHFVTGTYISYCGYKPIEIIHVFLQSTFKTQNLQWTGVIFLWYIFASVVLIGYPYFALKPDCSFLHWQWFYSKLTEKIFFPEKYKIYP